MILTETFINKNVVDSTALVLEGGAMRGVFTCGVLDWMMDHNLHFPYVIGVSAGACNGASYISNQKGRARFSNIELLEKYKYAGLKHYLKKRNFLDFDLLFNEFPYSILPFDFDTYTDSGKCFEMVTSNCLTGQAEYFEEYTDHDYLLTILRASSSMPFFSPVVDVAGTPMLDGGVCDSIPVARAIDKGYGKAVVVLTRNKGYRKAKTRLKVPSFILKQYPLMRDAINRRNELYNAQLDLVESLEREGKAIVIRPEARMTIDRIESDTNKLIHFYNHGYDCAATALRDLLN